MMEREEPWSPNRLIPFIASNADLVIPIELVMGEIQVNVQINRDGSMLK